MELELQGRVALVTGGASGIGRACGEQLALEGATVAILDRDPAGVLVADQLRSQGHKVSFFGCDVNDEGAIRSAAAHVEDEFGGIDCVVASAGVSGPVGASPTEISVDDWDRVMAVNVRGNFLLIKHTIDALRRSSAPAVVLVASDAALVATEGMAPYHASKAAVVMLAKSMSVDFPEVRFNSLCPGLVDTPMARKDLGRPDGFEGMAVPVMDAEQVAKQATFLVSAASYPVNGTTLVSDFGVFRPVCSAVPGR